MGNGGITTFMGELKPNWGQTLTTFLTKPFAGS